MDHATKALWICPSFAFGCADEDSIPAGASITANIRSVALICIHIKADWLPFAAPRCRRASNIFGVASRATARSQLTAMVS